jgi:uncharacterized metal-binding protein
MVPHRSWVSHSLLFGPVLRVLYFAGVLSLLALIVLGLLNLMVPVDPTGIMFKITATVSAWIQDHPATVAYAAAGFILGAAAHTIADAISSAVKRRI